MVFNAPSMRAYNVGSDQSVGVRELAETVVETLQPGTRIRVNKTPVPHAPISRYVPCTVRAKQELGLEVIIGLQEAIQRTATWYGFPSGRRSTGKSAN